MADREPLLYDKTGRRPCRDQSEYAMKFAIPARSFMTNSMADSQITISKNAAIGAGYLMPPDMERENG